MRRFVLALIAAGLAATASSAAFAAETLRVYGAGGPAPAMKEAAAVFGKAHGIEVQVTAGPTPQWIDHAKSGAVRASVTSTIDTPPAQADSPAPLAAGRGAATQEMRDARATGPHNEIDIFTRRKTGPETQTAGFRTNLL